MKTPSIKPSPCKIHYIEARLLEEINLNFGKWVVKMYHQEGREKGCVMKTDFLYIFCEIKTFFYENVTFVF